MTAVRRTESDKCWQGCGETWNPCALLVGMSNGTAATGNSVAVPQIIQNRITAWSSHSVSGYTYIPKRIESRFQSDISSPMLIAALLLTPWEKTPFLDVSWHGGNPVKLSFALDLKGGKELTLPIYLQQCKSQQPKRSLLQFFKTIVWHFFSKCISRATEKDLGSDS